MSTSRPVRRRRRGQGHGEGSHGPNHERWLLTYADMITLLMVLFIVLFAISVVDKKKFAELADGLAHQFGSTPKVLPAGTGVMDGGKTANHDTGQLTNNPDQPIAPISDAEQSHEQPSPAASASAAAQEKETLLDAQRRIQQALQAKGLAGEVNFRLEARGLVVSIVTDQVLFDTGKADLRPAGKQVLDAIAPVLRTLPNNFSVEGHTDNVPITGGPFASNWELSAVRATTVLRYLVSTDGLPEKRMSATGYADTRPIVPNDTPEHRQQNRRVDIVVLSTILTQALGGSP
ncbi:MAG: flagellar motor protein MotB [Acidothermus sp.]|nr:flagellar motor protein MotB [Acidothermus sp.]